MTDGRTRVPRRLRTDAAENRARILVAARELFTELGENASLNEVAKRAGVGSGTLYRHFPALPALLVAIVGDDVERLCARGRDLLAHDDPAAGLQLWLRAFVAHASTLRGLLAAHLAVEFGPGESNALTSCHDEIVATGAALLERSKRAGTTPAGVDVRDVLRLANAIAWASQQSPDDPGLVDRLFALSLDAPR